MSDMYPYELMFKGMEKFGPGSNEDTLKVLSMLPKNDLRLVIDAGCGAGRQTIVLAKFLGVPIHALDLFDMALTDLSKRAKEQRLDDLIKVHHMDMADIPKNFNDVDLIWCEASVYNIGFKQALESWASSLKPGGFLVVSEISWVKDHIPEQVKKFWDSEYPDMRTFQENVEITKKTGYKLLNTHLLSKDTWIDGYYDVLKPRAEKLKHHEDKSVRTAASGMLKEIDMFEHSQDSFAYSFFSLQR